MSINITGVSWQSEIAESYFVAVMPRSHIEDWGLVRVSFHPSIKRGCQLLHLCYSVGCEMVKMVEKV